MPLAIEEELIEQSVVITVELERVHAEAVAHLEVECRVRLDPAVVHPELDETLGDEGAGTELSNELLYCQMILHIGKTKPRWNPGYTRKGC